MLKEDVPPAMGDLTYSYTLEWSGPIVVHTWLHLSVAASDNVDVANVTFTFVPDGRVAVDTTPSGGAYQATFEIDFWSHYMNAWEASAQAFDPSGNVMARVAQGGAVSTLLGLASGLFGNPMTLAFHLFELLAIGLAVAVVGAVANDRESNWFEGLMLLIVYGIVAVGFFFLP